MREKRNRKTTKPSVELLGKACDIVQPILQMHTGDGFGGRVPSVPDCVDVCAFAKLDLTLGETKKAKMPGGCVFIGRTTIRKMVKYAIDGDIMRNRKLDKYSVGAYKRLRASLIDAIKMIDDVMPD